MYRKRLKSTLGCIQCKQRHRKCDEKRPRCSICARCNADCTWPTHLHQSGGDWMRSIAGPQIPRSPSREVIQGKSTGSLDPFHDMPAQYYDDRGMITERLHGFFVEITQQTLPFDITNTHHELSRGWLMLVYLDEAVCTSFVTYCAWFYSERVIRERELTDLCLRNEARSLAILRHRIESRQTITEGTLLAAALQFFIATFSTKNIFQLSLIAQGVSTLIMAMGGPNETLRRISPSTKQSLIFVDVFNSMLSTQKPFLENIKLPPKPLSYGSLLILSAIDTLTSTMACLEQELISIIRDLRFVLFFRAPSQQTRSLSSEESWYLFMLLQKISYDLCNQQYRLARSQTLSEIAIYGMMLVKEEVLLDIVQHPIMPTTILRRLQAAISGCRTRLQGPALTIALWASTMALIGTEFVLERTWAEDFITNTMFARYGLSWPQDWTTELRQDLQEVLWHHKIEIAFKKICYKVDYTRSYIVTHSDSRLHDRLE